MRARFEHRHSLRFAREGFVLPDLCISPLGERVSLAWRPFDVPSAHVKFLDGGSAQVAVHTLRETLAGFVDSVVARLADMEVCGTRLQEDWESIRNADEEVQEFCAAAAALGLDPYDLQVAEQDRIIAAAGRLPESIRRDFFSVADIAHLDQQSAGVRQELDAVSSLPHELSSLQQLRGSLPRSSAVASWDQGYEFARQLRQRLGIGEQILRSIEEIGKALDTDPDLLAGDLSTPAVEGLVDGILGINSKGSPGFRIGKRGEQSRRYTFCRILFEYLHSSGSDAALVSRVRSERQKRNCAFASEFLAPAELIRQRISGAPTGDEEIGEIAGEFNVSDYVIRHQIENHRLAETFTDW